jgi:predicted phosphohydrolase
MALEKVISEDKIEIVGEYKAVQVRTCTKVLEDGVELSVQAITGTSSWLVRTTAANQQKYKRFVQRFTRLKSSQPLKHHKETRHERNI